MNYGTTGVVNEAMNEVVPQKEEPSVVQRNINRVGVFVSVGLSCLLLIIGSFAKTGDISPLELRGQNEEVNLPVLSGQSIRSCDFEECNAANCDPQTAPYTCLFHNGGPHGGCSSIQWMSGTCDEQCNLANCEDEPLPDDVDTCDNVECGKWCDDLGLSVCGPAAPYQCQEGSGRFGCSDDEFHWTFKSSTNLCSSCCDGRTCEESSN
mmetsp:Transcript_22269/g.33786  ORF Transcript_22269/g.33786 Transcript_22269/m.33786 type:complete len:208 (+) Transcript_22269:132-755(+)|eukprot:CAMPEP_0194233106 /NCGR_PEP_ID=MMETSP0158-20130606/1195_1 /TAXON_ID=33649 /ORGANISM="Thalassionema nitzschioides, Strain L26-B" /LENGTH=207 /DNA_ID=CAMNT_0038965945 /DNA_START=42 /DNA_END=665 /DNA_ORIENTATION=+